MLWAYGPGLNGVVSIFYPIQMVKNAIYVKTQTKPRFHKIAQVVHLLSNIYDMTSQN